MKMHIQVHITDTLIDIQMGLINGQNNEIQIICINILFYYQTHIQTPYDLGPDRRNKKLTACD